ncbi:hypothetical protein EB231_15585 [Mesorhizobium sp. NZP2298]|nr:hypothetical protein EB231_15585 [Mesorhizobium sp. NZP2298]
MLHRKGDRAVRAEAGRYLAARIAGARFVEVEGEDHWFWVGEQRGAGLGGWCGVVERRGEVGHQPMLA